MFSVVGDEEFQDLKKQVQGLTLILQEQIRRLDAVQDLAVTASAYVRIIDRQLTTHLDALAAVLPPPPPSKPAKPGPEIA